MFGLGVGEIVIIAAAALIFIGPKKLPGMARTLGAGFREFQKAARGLTDAVNQPIQKQVDEIKKDLPSFEEQFKDDPPHDHGDTDDFVRPEDLNKPLDQTFEVADTMPEVSETRPGDVHPDHFKETKDKDKPEG